MEIEKIFKNLILADFIVIILMVISSMYQPSEISNLYENLKIPFNTINEVLNSLKSSETNQVVVPLENSINGSIVEVLDFLASKNSYHIVAELNIEINPSVYCIDSINNEDVRVVYSHPQALAQCYDYLINNFKNANAMLDWHYSYSGKVVYGNQLGREIGVPTANIWIPKQKLPISGVYAVRCLVDHGKYLGIANMGIRPTVGGTRPVLETHIFDFEKDIYGRRITVQFIEKIREEVKFDSIDLLKSQIKKDIEEAKKILD